MDNYTWLKEVANINENQWHSDIVIRSRDIPNYEFYDTKKSYTAIVEPADIKGIDYTYGYNDRKNITWNELLNQLIRFDDIRTQNSSLQELIDHAHNDYNQPKAVMKYGNILITVNAQHRLALAKFLDIPLIQVYVTEHLFNHEKYAKYMRRKKYIDRFKSLGLLNDEFEVDYHNCTDRSLLLGIYGNYCTVDEQAFDVFFEYYEKVKTNGFYAKFMLRLEGYINSFNHSNLKVEDKSYLYTVRHLIRRHKIQKRA